MSTATRSRMPGPGGSTECPAGEQPPRYQQGDHPRAGHPDHRQRAPRLLITLKWPVPPAGWAGRSRRGARPRRMNSVGVPEREPHVPPELLFDLLDRVERLPRVRALVIAVLEDQAAGGRTSDVIDVLVQRRPAFGSLVGGLEDRDCMFESVLDVCRMREVMVCRPIRRDCGLIANRRAVPRDRRSRPT